MGIKQFWEERPAGGKDAVVALLGGGAAIIFAYIVGADEGIVYAFGLTVTVALGVLGILAWAKSALGLG